LHSRLQPQSLQHPAVQSQRLATGVSGPYELAPSLDSIMDADTFSNFTPWDDATQEQHLASVLETLSRWRIALCPAP